MSTFNEILESQNGFQHNLNSTNLNQLQLSKQKVFNFIFLFNYIYSLDTSIAYQNLIQTSTLSSEPKTIDSKYH
jgi:hypothetical protein